MVVLTLSVGGMSHRILEFYARATHANLRLFISIISIVSLPICLKVIEKVTCEPHGFFLSLCLFAVKTEKEKCVGLTLSTQLFKVTEACQIS